MGTRINKTIMILFMLNFTLIMVACGSTQKYDISKPPYEFGTKIEKIIEIEGEPYIPDDNPNKYIYEGKDGKLLGYDSGVGWIAFYTNEQDELIEIRLDYVGFVYGADLDINIDIQETYNSMIKILNEKCDVEIEGFSYYTKDGLVKIIIKPDSKNWTNMTLRYQPTNLNEDGTFK